MSSVRLSAATARRRAAASCSWSEVFSVGAWTPRQRASSRSTDWLLRRRRENSRRGVGTVRSWVDRRCGTPDDCWTCVVAPPPVGEPPPLWVAAEAAAVAAGRGGAGDDEEDEEGEEDEEDESPGAFPPRNNAIYPTFFVHRRLVEDQSGDYWQRCDGGGRRVDGGRGDGGRRRGGLGAQ